MKIINAKTCAVGSLLLAGASMIGCSSDDSTDTSSTPAPTAYAAYVAANHELKGDFKEDITLEAGIDYKITGKVNFTAGTTLTIPAGVRLYGSTPSTYLAINAGATIIAKGDINNPIVFTSAEDVAGQNVDANGNPIVVQGQWGGLVLIGNAPIIGGTMTYEAGDQVGGGDVSDDNSGDLEYVVVKNTGFQVEVDKELNGLSLLAVGSGTTIKNVAILGGGDDGLEIWGGTVNIDGIYVYDAADDSLDTDMGYTGTISNAYALQYTVDKTNYDSSGIETGNDNDSYTSNGGNSGNVISDPTLANNTQPTMPTFRNVTVKAVGGAIYLKNDAGGIFDNVSVTTMAAQDPTQSVDVGQAIVTHRTVDVVEDLSGTPYGVQILAGGLELINEIDAANIYATENAKKDNLLADGSPDPQFDVKTYWEAIPGITVDQALLYYSDSANVTGADTANVWKGNPGDNNDLVLMQ